LAAAATCGYAGARPLDQILHLPARTFPYELQKRIMEASVQETREADRAEITGAPVRTHSIEDVFQNVAEDLDVFYARRDPQPVGRTPARS